MRIAINGFGRIGRLTLRAIVEGRRRGLYREIEVAAINDLAGATENAYLLQYDSVHGALAETVAAEDSFISVGKDKIRALSEAEPSALPWGEMGMDLVLECTGRFVKREAAAAHLSAGAKRVLISAPSPDADKTIVYGVNHASLAPDDTVISNASCTTNCLAPLASVLDDFCGIERGHMTTVHAYTGDQRLQDLAHQDLRRARAAALSMIPTSTGAAKAIGLVLPQLEGRITGTAIRVPTPNVSLIDLVFQPKRILDLKAMEESLRQAASGSLSGILGVSDAPLVSSDFNHNSCSCIYDATGAHHVEGALARVLAWYDNEWGFANRMADMASFLSA